MSLKHSSGHVDALVGERVRPRRIQAKMSPLIMVISICLLRCNERSVPRE